MASPNIVDVALVLAVDVSSSIDRGDFILQMRGIAKALRQPDVLEAIQSGPAKAMALCMMQWSTSQKQVVSVPWRVLQSESDMEAVAAAIENAQRDWRGGGTGMAAAISVATGLFDSLPAKASRLVIDVSGDGAENDGGNLKAARAAAFARNITINGLPVITSSLVIAGYYAQEVIGGDGAFTEPAQNLDDFSDAMHRKLLREILSPVT